MIDNFELIKSLFYFNEANNMFFHCQIVQRAKDHKPNKVKEGAINTYLIRSLAEYNLNGTVRDPRRILNSAAGELKSRNPKWVVDIDDISMMNTIADKLFELYAEAWKKKGSDISVEALKEVGYDYIYAQIPTKQGIHLIVRPFNLQAFHKAFPDVDIHKNSMGTVLYVPNSLNHRYVCSECGSPNIQVQAWVNANTHEYADDIIDGANECWCEDCGKHTKLKEV